MSHSVIAPSAAYIWGKPGGCTGYPTMAQLYPDVGESPEAADGTASHEIGATLIEMQTRGFISEVTADLFVGKKATNGIVFTEEMFDAAKEYADHVGELMRKTGIVGGENLGIEYAMKAPRIHALSYGTTDCYVYYSGVRLSIYDYKFGYQIVEAFENWQGINYAAGIVDDLNIPHHVEVDIIIVQPRAHHRDGTIRTWSTTVGELRAYFNILEANASIALSPHAATHTGDHCKYCTARHGCDAALSAGVDLFEVASKPVPLEMSPDAMGFQLSIVKRALRQLSALESGYEEQLKCVIRGGANVAGWVVEQGLGRERWTKSVAEVVTFGNMFGHDLRKPVELITPPQAKKLGIDAAVISAYSETPRTGLKIVADNENKAKQVFKNVK